MKVNELLELLGRMPGDANVLVRPPQSAKEQHTDRTPDLPAMVTTKRLQEKGGERIAVAVKI